jgi:RHS repeat-associated protein
VASFAYDALNRQTSVSYSDATPSATYTYDEASSSLLSTIENGKGRMTSAWTSDGIGYSWSYDEYGRVIEQKASVDGEEFPLEFSFAGRTLQNIKYPDDTLINYHRDDIGRITKIYNDWNNPYAEYEYNSEMGSVSGITFGDSIEEHYHYDTFGRLGELHMHNGPDYSKWYYEYNASSLISKITQQINQGASSDTTKYEYLYDHLQRLSSAIHSVSPSQGVWDPPDQINSFAYDQFGNMLTNELEFPNDPGQDSQTTFDVNHSNNRLNSYNDGQNPVTTLYDPAGNMTAEGSQTYTYDGAGRMVAVGVDIGIYRYDALGRRVQKTYDYEDQSGTITGSIISIYGPGGILLVEYRTETNPSGSNIWQTNHILNGSATIAKETTPQTGDPTTEYLHRNHLSQAVDPISYSFGYGIDSAYGRPFGSGGDDQFSGHKEDAESGLHYNLARSYNPIGSRWLSADPITANIHDPQGLNKYGYNRNGPINFVDPDGRLLGWFRELFSGGGGIISWTWSTIQSGALTAWSWTPFYNPPASNLSGSLGQSSAVGNVTVAVSYIGADEEDSPQEAGTGQSINVCLDTEVITLNDGNGEELFSDDIIVGCDKYETPEGDFQAGDWIEDKTNPEYGPIPWSEDFTNPYGPWFLPINDLNGQYTTYGIHGTAGPGWYWNPAPPFPGLWPGDFWECSHGCVRLSNRGIYKLHDLLPNPRRTPIRIGDCE